MTTYSLSPQKSQGVILVAALFLMLVVALLVVYLLRTGSETYWSGVLRIQQARAYQAAQAGLEWGLHQINPATSGGACPAGANPRTINFTGTDGDLAGFKVIVTCTATPYNELTGAVTVYELDAVSSFGTFGSSPDYVSQHLKISVEG